MSLNLLTPTPHFTYSYFAAFTTNLGLHTSQAPLFPISTSENNMRCCEDELCIDEARVLPSSSFTISQTYWAPTWLLTKTCSERKNMILLLPSAFTLIQCFYILNVISYQLLLNTPIYGKMNSTNNFWMVYCNVLNYLFHSNNSHIQLNRLQQLFSKILYNGRDEFGWLWFYFILEHDILKPPWYWNKAFKINQDIFYLCWILESSLQLIGIRL